MSHKLKIHLYDNFLCLCSSVNCTDLNRTLSVSVLCIPVFPQHFGNLAALYSLFLGPVGWLVMEVAPAGLLRTQTPLPLQRGLTLEFQPGEVSPWPSPPGSRKRGSRAGGDLSCSPGAGSTFTSPAVKCQLYRAGRRQGNGKDGRKRRLRVWAALTLLLAMNSGKPRGKKLHYGDVISFELWAGVHSSESQFSSRPRLLLPTAPFFCYLCSDCRPHGSQAVGPSMLRTHCKDGSGSCQTCKQICASRSASKDVF